VLHESLLDQHLVLWRPTSQQQLCEQLDDSTKGTT
jgi:hypothetical protein